MIQSAFFRAKIQRSFLTVVERLKSALTVEPLNERNKEPHDLFRLEAQLAARRPLASAVAACVKGTMTQDVPQP